MEDLVDLGLSHGRLALSWGAPDQFGGVGVDWAGSGVGGWDKVTFAAPLRPRWVPGHRPGVPR